MKMSKSVDSTVKVTPFGKLEDRKFKIIPTILGDQHYRVLFGIGIIICAITIIFAATALNHEMAGIFATRPFDVGVFIFVFCILIISGILLYPLLAIHFRSRILVEERVVNLHKKWQEGNAEFIEELGKERPFKKVWDEINIKYPDYAYLYAVIDQHFKDNPPTTGKGFEQTEEQQRQDYLRKLIRATAFELIEDSSYSVRSYELPVIFCMLSVAFGFVIFSLVPFLGTGEIAFGESSMNLIWAAGGFVGAYIYSLYPLFQRYTRRDLPPRAFLDYAIKVFLGTIAVTVFGNFFLLDFAPELQFAFAAVLGSVPFLVLNQSRKRVFSKIGLPGKNESVGSLDVSSISGINYDYSLRLHEEGIMNIQQLAFANVEVVSDRTMFTIETLFDWKNEAVLRLLTGNTPISTFLKDTRNGETLYDALTKVGINTVSDLSNFLDCNENESGKDKASIRKENAANLIKLLGWEGKDEYKFILTKVCHRGEEILGKAEELVSALGIKPKAQ